MSKLCVTLFSDKITCIARLAILSNEEWSKVLLERSCLFSESVDLVERVAEGDVAAKELIVKLERRNNPMCQCVSHNDDESYGFTYALMEISPPLTDDSGNTLASVLLPYCLKAAGLKNVAYESVRPGSSTSVKYILQLPSGDTSLFSGWPDHHLLQTYTTTERRLGQNVLKQERVRGVGEVQSPQGITCASKNAAVAQAGIAQVGIYSVGQFGTPSPNKRRIATVILYKDLTAHIAVATLDSTKASKKESLGEISYKLVDSVHGYQLNDQEGLAKFSSVFIGTVKSTLIPITR